jgi:F-type H+-transporting ATPase subunit b
VTILHIASESTAPAQESVTATFGISWQALLFQAITFLLVVLILKKFVVGKIYDIIDAREKAINDGLDKAAQAKKELSSAQDEIDTILKDARTQAETIVASAKKESADLVKSAEDKAVKRAESIIADAQSKLAVDVEKARHDLRAETARLIGEVAETILHEKLTSTKDQELIVSELERRREK